MWQQNTKPRFSKIKTYFGKRFSCMRDAFIVACGQLVAEDGERLIIFNEV